MFLVNITAIILAFFLECLAMFDWPCLEALSISTLNKENE